MFDVARSVTSPQTLLQSTEDHVAPGIEATALPDETLRVPTPPEVTSEGVKVSLEAAGADRAGAPIIKMQLNANSGMPPRSTPRTRPFQIAAWRRSG
ncbi:hypothetical protein [Sorangium sp. So ce362]|uniref:hypothetical protein n=1 Tax=Sorangium sp. So ce362 TaxID=3133303 RepID=UPI003F5D88A6